VLVLRYAARQFAAGIGFGRKQKYARRLGEVKKGKRMLPPNSMYRLPRLQEEKFKTPVALLNSAAPIV